jgi:hypothetical protein
LASGFVTSTDKDLVALGSELASDFLANALVGTGDENGLLGL